MRRPATTTSRARRPSAVLTLLRCTLAHRKTRSALTIAAIALAVSLVVAVTSGYTSAEEALQQFVQHYVGAGSIDISPRGDPKQVFPEQVASDLAQDPAAQRVVGRLIVDVTLGDDPRRTLGMATALATGVSLPDDAQVQSMKLDAGQWFTGASGDVAVVDQVLAERLNLKVDGELTLLHPQRPLKLRIVGIVHKPVILAMAAPGLYVPLRTLQDFAGRNGMLSRALVDLEPGLSEADFAQRWEPKLDALEPQLRLRRAGQRQEEMHRQLGGIRALSYLGGAVAMLAAGFIVFATLSMGVAERSRTLAMLRAVGALKWQIGRLVIYEGILLALIGGVLGVGLGWVWLQILARYHNTVFAAGVVMSLPGVIYGAGGMVVASVAASFLPAWTAMRLSPLEALAPLGRPPRARSPWLAAAAGLLLIAIDPLIVIVLNLPREWTFHLHFFLGLPALFLGFFLLSPAFVWLIERSVGRVVAWTLRLDYVLLRQQLSGSLWRSAGTAAALMVGLAILVVMQVQGKTLLDSWRLPVKFPDVFIVAPFGLSWEQQKILQTAPGIKPDQVLPIAISSPQLGIRLFSLGSTAFLPDATMFFGIDPDKAFDMIEFEYREGNAADARRMLKQGRHLIVTNEFKQLKGLGVGDKLPLKTPMSGTVQYTVAAVVWSPGLDVITSAFDMGRQLEQRTVASVCGSLEDAKRDFGIEQVNLFAANLEVGIERQDLARTLSARMSDPTANPTTGPSGFSAASLQRLLGNYGFLVGDVRHIKHMIQEEFKKLLMVVSSVALAAIAVASLGVTNTIMASVRSRQWQFGILRSVGVTRMQLLRIVLAEAVLLGLVGSGIGLAAGFLMSLDAHAFMGILLGYTPPMAIPWGILWLGVGIIVAVALLAAIVPAIAAARAKVLDLLQSGRAAA